MRWYLLLLSFLMMVGSAQSEPRVYKGHIEAPEESSLETKVLRTQAEFQQFQRRLPKFRVSKRQPAPPSQDPLLHRKRLGKPLAVIVRPANLSFHPEFLRTRLRKGTLEVHYRLPEEEAEARVYGMGSYTAIEIEQPFSSIRFIQKP